MIQTDPIAPSDLAPRRRVNISREGVSSSGAEGQAGFDAAVLPMAGPTVNPGVCHARRVGREFVCGSMSHDGFRWTGGLNLETTREGIKISVTDIDKFSCPEEYWGDDAVSGAC